MNPIHPKCVSPGDIKPMSMAELKDELFERHILLPGRYRLPGIVLSLLGGILLVARFAYNYTPAWLDARVPVIYSVYVEAKYFTIIRNQLIEEIAGILFFAGLILWILAKKKKENTIVNRLRLAAFRICLYACCAYLFFSLLFIYGFGFLMAMLFFPVFIFCSFIIVFEWKYYWWNKKR